LDKKEFPKPVDMSGQIGLGSREDLLNELTALDEKRGKIALSLGQALLASAKARVLSAGLTDAICRQRHGDLSDSLIVLEDEIRLLVLGKHNSSGSDHVSSNLERVVRSLHKPILVVADSFSAPNSIMIAYDGSDTTKKAISIVASSPLFKGLSCHVVMVGAAATAKMQAELDWAKAMLEASQLEATTAIVSGDVQPALSDYIEMQHIDMLVMGAYGHSKIRQFLVGSTTTKMLQHSRNVPLLLLR
jgi:nucleotide-binding universal stress UspA family protein